MEGGDEGGEMCGRSEFGETRRSVKGKDDCRKTLDGDFKMNGKKDVRDERMFLTFDDGG